MRPTLLLNLEGVCHPVGVNYPMPEHPWPPSFEPGPAAFSWAAPLQTILERWDIAVVFRSSAVSIRGFNDIKGLAPTWLRERIIGTTTEVVRRISLDELRKVNTSWGVIQRYVAEHGLAHWVVLADDADGWPENIETLRHLVLCDSEFGLTDPLTLGRLEQALIACKP